MTGLMWATLAVAAAVLGVTAVRFVAVVLAARAIPIRPASVALAEPPAALGAAEQAAVDEITALGFRPLQWARVDYGPDHVRLLLLHHEHESAFASLLLGGSQPIDPVAFYSFAEGGGSLKTVNRSAWYESLLNPPGCLLIDAYADTLESHFQVHVDRLRENRPLAVEPPAAIAHILDGYRERLGQLSARGALASAGEVAHLTLGSALRVGWNWLKARRRLARPYHTQAFYRDPVPYYTRWYLAAAQEPQTAIYTRTGWTLLAGGGLLLLAASLAGPGVAVALLAVAALHEAGHLLAARLTGARLRGLFLVPLLNGTSAIDLPAIPVWKAAMVLIAGPLPGLLIGLALLRTDALGPLPHARELLTGAGLAVALNTIALLPIGPLEGGRLLELALFRRWPWTRLPLTALGVIGLAAASYWSRSWAMWVVSVLYATTLFADRDKARLATAFQEGLPREAQVEQLFRAATERIGRAGFETQRRLVDAVFAQRAIRRPRGWEVLLILALLIGFWSACGLIAFEQLFEVTE